MLSRNGGTGAISDAAEIPALLTRDVDPNRHVEDFKATVANLSGNSELDSNRLAMTGFCFGGGMTWRAAAMIPELKAAAPFYGPPPPLDQVPGIKAAVLGIYSDDPNDFANEGQADLIAALEAASITHQINLYSETHHAFHNHTGQRYNEEQALTAWRDTVDWVAQYVEPPLFNQFKPRSRRFA